jgi:hypothetical protein
MVCLHEKLPSCEGWTHYNQTFCYTTSSIAGDKHQDRRRTPSCGLAADRRCASHPNSSRRHAHQGLLTNLQDAYQSRTQGAMVCMHQKLPLPEGWTHQDQEICHTVCGVAGYEHKDSKGVPGCWFAAMAGPPTGRPSFTAIQAAEKVNSSRSYRELR